MSDLELDPQVLCADHKDNASLIDYKNDIQYRIDWTRENRRKESQQEIDEIKDKQEYDQIDWNDFCIVETVEYQQIEAATASENFPLPVTVEELGKRLTQQLRYEEFGDAGLRQELADEKKIQEDEDRRLEALAEAEAEQNFARETAQQLMEEEQAQEQD